MTVGETLGLGIDFGTTNSILASHDGRQALALRDGLLPHASIVWYSEGGRAIVGREAKGKIDTYGDQPGHAFVRSIKRSLGTVEYIDVLGERRSTVEVAAEIFRHLREDAERRPDWKSARRAVRECVVTVPIKFGGERRAAIRRAAEHAGIHVKTFVHEPFAAAVAFLHRQKELERSDVQPRLVLVFDWGGGTLDVTLVEVTRDSMRELGVEGIPDRGGDDFDQLIKRQAISDFLETYGLPADGFTPRNTAKDKLSEEAEARKIDLSEKTDVTIRVPHFATVREVPRDIAFKVDRAAFERLIQPDVDRAAHIIDLVMAQAGRNKAEVDYVLAVGGTSRIPSVIDMLRHSFGVRVTVPTDADSIIAEGAALVSFHNWRPHLVQDVSICLSDGALYPVFPAGTVLVPDLPPREPTFFCTDPREGSARIIVCEATGTRKDRTCGVLTVPVKQHSQAELYERLQTRFHFDQDVVLRANARGTLAGQASSMTFFDLRFGLKFRGA